jgi:hypothetical protein
MSTFPYYTGGRAVKGDPLRIYRRLLTGLGADPNKWLERFDDLADDEAREKVLAATGWAFEMVQYDRETGLGDGEALVESTLRSFLEWLEKNGLPAVTSRTWSPPTAPASSPSTPGPTSGCNSG